MSFIIGREKGKNVILLPKPQISSQHVMVVLNDDTSISIEDLDSTNGTFVNGKKVKRTTISSKDQIRLGDVPVKFEWIKEELLRMLKMQRTDFTEEFARLKNLRPELKLELKKEKRSVGLKNQLLRLVITVIPIGIGIVLFGENSSVRMILMYSSPALFGVLQMYSPYTEKSEERIEDLKESFSLRYRCPKCSMSFGNQKWQSLASQKRCQRCDALWMI